MSLRLKLVLLFLAVAIIPLFFVSVLTFHNYKTSLETTLLSNLQDITAFKADKTETFFFSLKGSLETARSFYNIKKNLPILTAYAGDPNQPEFIAAKQALDDQLQHVQSVLQLMDIMLVSPDGRVVYSSNSRHSLLDFLNPLSDPAQTAFEEGKSRLFLSDIFPNKNDDNKPTILLTAPAVNLDGFMIGVIVFEVDTTALYKVIQDITGLGKTGEVLVGKMAGNKVLFLTPLKFDPDAILKRTADIGGQLAVPLQLAVGGKTGAGLLIDYRGQNVIAAWRYIPSLNWGLVAKIDADEAFTEVNKLRNLAFIILGIVLVLSSITAFSIARSIAEPIKKLSEGAAIIGSGNLDYKIGTPLKDEVGQLSRSFDKMTRDLKQTLASRDELNREVRERKQAQEELAAAHRRLGLAQQSAGAGIWDWNLKTQAFVWSPELFRLFGLDPNEQPTYALWENILHPQDSEQAKKRVEQAIQNRTPLDSEFRIFLPTGQVRWINTLGSAVYDENGKPQTMSGICIDITERKEIEQALWDSQKRFSSVFHTSPAGIFVTRMADGLFLEANEAYLQIIGYSAREIDGQTSLDLNLWVDPQARQTIIDLLDRQGRIDNSEIKLRRKNGEVLDVLYSAVLYEQAGEACILGTLMDISKSKQAEQALRESREDLKRAQAVAHVGSWRLDIRQNTLVWSDEAYRIFNAPTATPLTYESFLNYVHPDDRQYLDSNWKAALAGQKYDIEHRIIVDGQIKWVRERAELEFAQDDSLLGGFGTVTDITELKQAQESLRKSHDELETRVKERTADLDEMVVELQTQVEQRIRAEEVIKAERRRFENVLEMMPAYAVLLRPDYTVAYANRTFRKWFGDDNGKKCHEFLFNLTEPCENCQTYDVLKTGKSQFWEWTGPNDHNYDIYDYPFNDIDGSPLIMEIGVDVTAHKKAQEAVREGEERYRSLTVATTQVVWTTDAQGQVIDDMPSWREFTGQNVDEIKGWGWINALHPEDRDRTAKIWTQSVQEKNLYETEYRIRRHDGIYRYMSVRGVPVIEPDGSIREWVGTCTDITERKLAQEKQDITKSLLELFVRNSTRKEYLDAVVEEIRNWSGCEFVGIRIRDNEQNIPYESSVGFDTDFLAKENFLHLGHDNCTCMRTIMEVPHPSATHLTTGGGSFFCNDLIGFSNGLSGQDKNEYRGTCMKHGFQSIAVIPIRYRDEVMGAIHIADLKKDMASLPKIQFIETTIAPLVGEAAQRFNAESELEQYRLLLEDLVRQRTLELEKTNRQLQSEVIHRQQIAENLARSNKDLEQFAYVASHDLQEPLRAVAGFVDLLKRNLQESLDDKTAEYMNFTIDGARRMQSLVNGLLEYSRVSAKGKEPEQTDSKAALDLAIAHLHTSIQESQAAVTADDLPRVHVDAVQLTQLFQNLIGNAIKFHGPQPPRIHISAARQGVAWQFAVADNGIGIEPQYAERIFLIFHRLHTRKQYPGTGIGLAICKKIIERHGGKIWVESKPECGSTFYFTIPDRGETNNENGKSQS